VSVLDARAAYRVWAPGYGENALTCLEDSVAQALSPSTEGKRLLDAGCGTGRRLQACDAALAVGVDASPEMLAAGAGARAAADVRALPFAGAQFDLVWCRLVLGYVPDPAPAYREFARVCRRNGHLLVSDFHPKAAATQKRSFRDGAGAWHEIRNYPHDAARHAAAAAGAGFRLSAQREGTVGPLIRDFYVRAGRIADYERNLGTALVAAFLFQRTG
jgi:ubiquinone/menaquinone biosynthesis C-methylase UbiE